MEDKWTEEQQRAAERVAKLLALAGKNPNEHEAAAAAEKAQAILLEHNLSMASVDRARGTLADGRREEAKQRGGMYVYQRELWRAVAELNFCIYITHKVWGKKIRKGAGGREYGWEFRHVVIGRVVNTQATVALAGYLDGVIERLCRERLHGRGDEHPALFFSRWAVSYREGIAERVVERLKDRRNQQVAEEERRRRAELKRRMGEASVATALTIADAEQQEKDLNEDFRRGREPGTTARRRAEHAEEAAREEAEYAAWAVAHPEEARKKEEEARKATERFWRRYRGGPKEREKDWGAYRAGYDAGDKVGLDQQVGAGASDARRIGHG